MGEIWGGIERIVLRSEKDRNYRGRYRPNAEYSKEGHARGEVINDRVTIRNRADFRMGNRDIICSLEFHKSATISTESRFSAVFFFDITKSGGLFQLSLSVITTYGNLPGRNEFSFGINQACLEEGAALGCTVHRDTQTTKV